MTESDYKGNTVSDRRFDWGPPANKAADGVKDWLVYVFVIVLLGTGIWVFLDITGSKPEFTSVPAARPAAPGAAPAAVSAVSAPVPEASAPKHFVQLGAFGDRSSADEIFAQLEKYEFKPTLALPDKQYELYRIFLGPFENEKRAEEVAEKLNELDFPCFVIEQWQDESRN